MWSPDHWVGVSNTGVQKQPILRAQRLAPSPSAKGLLPPDSIRHHNSPCTISPIRRNNIQKEIMFPPWAVSMTHVRCFCLCRYWLHTLLLWYLPCHFSSGMTAAHVLQAGWLKHEPPFPQLLSCGSKKRNLKHSYANKASLRRRDTLSLVVIKLWSMLCCPLCNCVVSFHRRPSRAFIYPLLDNITLVLNNIEANTNAKEQTYHH